MRRILLVAVASVAWPFAFSLVAAERAHLLPVEPFFDTPASFGEMYAKVIEQKLFGTPNWSIRYYEVLENPSATTGLSIYQKDDGKYWMRVRQSKPEIAVLMSNIRDRDPNPNPSFDAITTEGVDCELPKTTAAQLQRLWMAFLRQTKPREKVTDKIYVTPPMVILFAKGEDATVVAGKFPPDAWDYPTFLSLGKIIDGLVKCCDAPGKDREHLFETIDQEARALRKLIGGESSPAPSASSPKAAITPNEQ